MSISLPIRAQNPGSGWTLLPIIAGAFLAYGSEHSNIAVALTNNDECDQIDALNDRTQRN